MHVEDLANKILKASQEYYAGVPIMSDAEFDTLEAELARVAPNHPVLSQIGSPVGGTGWKKVNHPFIMGSLPKAQSQQELAIWANSGPRHAFVITEKMDGISILLTYKNGELASAVTRGDGDTGEDITRNVRAMKFVPSTIPMDGEVHVRGEIVCRKDDFAAHFVGDSNPRNTAAGTAKSQKGWQKCRHLSVYAYNLHLPDSVSHRTIELKLLRDWGFVVPNYETCGTVESVYEVYKTYLDSRRGEIPYEIDGLVVEYDSFYTREKMGKTPDGKYPKGSIAFKFPHDSATTSLVDIVWQTGPSGRITPVAIFEPVLLAGAMVSRASLHNPDYVDSLLSARGVGGLNSGDQILVSRRNDVIPAVEELIATGGGNSLSTIVSECPSCGSTTTREGAYLVCRKGDTCPAQITGMVKRWLSKTGVLHFGEVMVEAVCEAGLVKTLGDLYRLEESQVAALKVDGRIIGGAAKRALESLHNHKEMTLDVLVGSLGINLCGRRVVSFLMDGGVDTLEKMESATESDIAAIQGFGSGRASEFKFGFNLMKYQIIDLLEAGVTIVKPQKPTTSGNGLAGTSFCFTGVRDKDLESAIEQKGGEIKSGVSRGLSILVCKDPGSTSGKAQKARDLGIRVMSLESARELVAEV